MLTEIAPRLAGLLLMFLACLTAGAAPALAVHRGSRNLERGLRERDDVIFYCDFESDRWYEEWGLRKASRNSDTVSADPDRRFKPFAGKALRIKVAAGTHYGVGDLSFDFGKQLGRPSPRLRSTSVASAKEVGREPEEVCFRYYLRFGSDWEPVFGGKLPGVSGTYGRAGWGGRPCDGKNGWSARGLFERPRDGKTAIGYYCYHADMKGQYGSGWVWERNRLGYLERNRWYCVEQHVRMNTPGRNDGVMRGWIDGKLAFEKTDVRMRDVASLRIEKVWMNVYHGGKTPARTDDHLYIDNVVIARRCIGPRSGSYASPYYPSFDAGALLDGGRLTALRTVRQNLARGELGRALVAAERESSSSNADRAAEAKAVVEALTAWADGAVAALTKLKATDPETATDELNRLATQLGTSKPARELKNTVREWEKEPATVKARKARRIFVQLEWVADQLAVKPGRLAPDKGLATDAQFARRYRNEILFLQRGVKLLGQKYADTQSYKEAQGLLTSLGIGGGP